MHRIFLVVPLALAAAGCPDDVPPAPRGAPSHTDASTAEGDAAAADALVEGAPFDGGGDGDSPPAPETRVVLLGTGTPRADPDRAGPSVAVVVRDQAYLVDCGAGVVRQAAAAHRAGIEALDVRRLDRGFVTHLHSDHTLGLDDLLLTPWILGRSRPIELYGPPGLRKMVDGVRGTFAEDLAVRSKASERLGPGGPPAKVVEVEPGEVYRDDLVVVRAFPVKHGAWRHAYGYRFESADRTVVISGDTTATDAVVEACDGCDVLVHEVYGEGSFSALPAHVQAYHASFHTSTSQLARLASRARPGLLVLYHQLTWERRGVPVDEDLLLSEIRRGWQGPVVSGRDLDVY